MAYTDGYDYDIFISYSHDDNDEKASPAGRKGWITEFHDYLYNWLVKKRHLKGLKLWFDTELNGNTLFDKAIEDRISRSALFFVLHSKNYQDSAYCRKELGWFFQHNTNRSEGLVVGDESRLLNILINNIPYPDWPQALSQAGGPSSGFVLHNPEAEGEYCYPTSMDDSRFDRQLHKLVEAIAKTLDSFPRHLQAAPQIEAPTAGPSLFLSDVADTLRPLRKRLIAEIGDKALILDDLPPPYPIADHKQALESTLQQADLSIHLLDQWPGRVVDGLEEVTYSRFQAEAASCHQTPSMIWVPDNLKHELIEDEQQAVWLKGLEQGERGENNFQFIRSGRQALIDQVLQTITSLQQHTDGGNPVSYLIDTHQKDQRFAFNLADLLSEQGMDVEFNQESRDPVKSLTDFEQSVREVQNLVIMFGQVAPEWLKGRMQTTVKVIADQLQTGNPILNKLWIFLLPGCPGQHAIPSIPLLRVDLLDNSLADRIEPDLLKQLLNAGQGGANP